MASIYLSILIASIASFIFGMIWYGPAFGKTWMKLTGVKGKGKKISMLYGFIATLVTAYVIAVLILSVFGPTGDFASGARLAFWLWLGIAAPMQIGAVIWENKPFKLFLLNTTYQLINFIIIAGIISSL